MERSRGMMPRSSGQLPGDRDISRRNAIGILIAITVVAAILRLGWPNSSPPGLQVDEASNAWNAWCLLKTVHDEHGDWPSPFYARALGDYRSSLYLYFLIPFQAVFGMTEH